MKQHLLSFALASLRTLDPLLNGRQRLSVIGVVGDFAQAVRLPYCRTHQAHTA